MPAIRHVYVGACPVCGATVWTYKRAGGLPQVGPHKVGPKGLRNRRYCAGEGRTADDFKAAS